MKHVIAPPFDKKVKIRKKLQKSLIEDYKKLNTLTWKEMAKRFSIGESTLRYFLRYGISELPKYIFDEIIQKEIKYKIVNKRFKSRRYLHKRKYCGNAFTKKYGNDYYSIMGRRGAIGQKTLFRWTTDRILAHSAFGKIGGNKRISNSKYLTIQEKKIFNDNKRKKINFKSNHFIDKDNNFDFVYYDDDGKISLVEEVSINSYRALAYFLEKRKLIDTKLSKDIPFLVAYENSKPEINEFLLNNNIYSVEIKTRTNAVSLIREERIAELKNLIKKTIVQTTKDYRYINCLKSGFSDEYEKLVNCALKNFKPQGKVIFTGKYGSKYVPDNVFSHNKKKIAVLVSSCKTRGSLFYSFFNHSSQSIIYKKLFYMDTLSIIFDFSNTSASYTNNRPRELWDKYCKYKIIVNNKNLKYLNNRIISVVKGG